MEIKLKSDTRRRKQTFTAKSFAHPAKMALGLQEFLIDRYSKGMGEYEFTEEMLKEVDKVIDWCQCEGNQPSTSIKIISLLGDRSKWI